MAGFDLAHYRSAVFDLDGTVWLSGEPMPGAAEFLDRCRASGVTVAFATNISLIAAEDVRRQLLECGLALPGEHVVTAGSAVADSVAASGATDAAVLCSPALVAALESRGVRAHAISSVDREAWREPAAGRALVMAGWPEATLREMEAIGQLAAWGHPLFISSLDPGFPGSHGFEPGAGMIMAAIRALHGVDPIVCGKPSAHYASAVRAGLPDGPVVMFGDSQRADIGLAHLLGADGVLLVGDPPKPVDAGLQSPAFTAGSLAELPMRHRGGAPAAGPGPAHAVATRGIVYLQRDGFRPLELDLHRPGSGGGANGVGALPLPVIVHVHGGGWRVSSRSVGPRETRAWERDVFDRWTDAGFAVAAVEYRYSAEALHPAPIEDVTAAIAWLVDHAAEQGLDTDRIVLWGQSAGGHVAASAALAPGAPPVRGVVCWYPLTDLVALDGHDDSRFAEHYLGHPIGDDPVAARAASPIAHVHAGAPPFLLQHGTADTMAPYEQSVLLADALRRAGVGVELDTVEGAEHFFAGHADVDSVFERAVAFARRVVGFDPA